MCAYIAAWNRFSVWWMFVRQSMGNVLSGAV